MENDRSSGPDPVLGSRIQKVLDLLSRYDGKIPLHHWLKEEFRKHRNWGSRDRRFYRQACFSVFRFFPGFKKEELCNELVLTALIIAGEDVPGTVFTTERSVSLRSEIQPYITKTFEDWREYWASFENTPPTWLISFAHAQKLKEILLKENIPFEQNGKAFLLPSNSNLDKIPAHLYRVMDLGTQLSLEDLALVGAMKVWDCCAGAGGKSLLLSEKYPGIELYCTDSRASILENLSLRFIEARLKQPAVSVYDISDKNAPEFNTEKIRPEFFDCILADVPCTGSGTWRRSPEQLHFFDISQILIFADRQKKIISNTLSYLKPGGLFIYITCSVFTAENEEQIPFILENKLELISSGYLGGYHQNADLIYRAVFKKLG